MIKEFNNLKQKALKDFLDFHFVCRISSISPSA